MADSKSSRSVPSELLLSEKWDKLLERMVVNVK